MTRVKPVLLSEKLIRIRFSESGIRVTWGRPDDISYGQLCGLVG